MSGVAGTKVPAFNFTVHPSASPFMVTRQAYSTTHPHTSFIATGALVFDTSDQHVPRILLVQRSASDTMPNQWEVPGGGCDDEDETILHAVARELWEEAGLKASDIGAPAGEPQYFTSRSGKPICRLNFVVQVEVDAETGLQPTLDPAEHQRFVWASEDEIRAKRVNDLDLDFTSQGLQDSILQCFDQMKQN